MEIENKIAKSSSKKSNNKIFAVLAIIILILVIISTLNNNKSAQNNFDSKNNIKSENNKELVNKYQTKTDYQANVTIDVTPKKLNLSEEKNVFEISFNTHSVDLSYDFQKIIILKDDLGNTYQALEWTGGEGGHHMDGEIVFPKLNSNAIKVELTIDGVGGVKRVFEWTL
ncbi:MAG: hypothetical protein P1P85_04790 [Patescibacteria group bacterium]|nr:hypothetical protein [Patescibacteria group bacterium]